MESITPLFSGLSETLTANMVPIAIFLGVIILALGWMFYNSKVASVKETYAESPEEPESEEAEASDEGENEQGVEESPTE